MDSYQSYIHKSRYARYLPEFKRREEWNETVERYASFMWEDTKLVNVAMAILDMEVMPSMRAFMTAGLALGKDHAAGYNCSYLPVNRMRAFDETLYVLMCGVGVGFSVERQYVNKLPTIPLIPILL